MIYTFQVFYNAADAKHRAASVIHFEGETLDEITQKAAAFAKENPEYKLGACIPGSHTVFP